MGNHQIIERNLMPFRVDGVVAVHGNSHGFGPDLVHHGKDLGGNMGIDGDHRIDSALDTAELGRDPVLLRRLCVTRCCGNQTFGETCQAGLQIA